MSKTQNIIMEHAKFWQEFFQLYKELPALWRARSTEYADRVLKSKCYLPLIKKLKEIYPDADREMVVKKINNFRTSYRKELKKIKESKQVGKKYKPTLWYFDSLRFLDDQDIGGCEKSINEDEHTEGKQQVSKDVTNTITCKKLPTKRVEDFKDSEEESLPKKKKIIHQYHIKQPTRLSFEEQQQAKIDADILAKSWAIQYKELQGSQKLITRKLISDILFYGCLGTLNMSHIIDFQEILQKDSTNVFQHTNLQTHSPADSNSSFRFAEQEYLNYDSIRHSPIEFNSPSPPISPTTNAEPDLQINDIKFEVP